MVVGTECEKLLEHVGTLSTTGHLTHGEDVPQGDPLKTPCRDCHLNKEMTVMPKYYDSPCSGISTIGAYLIHCCASGTALTEHIPARVQ